MQSKTEDDKRQASPTTACPAWCISHNADTPDKANDHLHEATWGAWCFSDWGSFSSRESIG